MAHSAVYTKLSRSSKDGKGPVGTEKDWLRHKRTSKEY